MKGLSELRQEVPGFKEKVVRKPQACLKNSNEDKYDSDNIFLNSFFLLLAYFYHLCLVIPFIFEILI